MWRPKIVLEVECKQLICELAKEQWKKLDYFSLQWAKVGDLATASSSYEVNITLFN